MSTQQPRPGRRIYVPSTAHSTGGLGELQIIVGSDKVFIKEAPDVEFSWGFLCENQVDLVQKFGGLKAIDLKKRSRVFPNLP